MPPDSIIVFINAQRVDVPAGSTALEAVRRWNAESATQITSGTRQLSDARGLPLDADTPVYGGAIFRVTGGRRGVAAAPGGDES